VKKLNIIRNTCSTPSILNEASPRASLALMRIAQALALYDGLEFVSPEHIQEIAEPVIAHRLMLDSQTRLQLRVLYMMC